jgi:hypothetical protein
MFVWMFWYEIEIYVWARERRYHRPYRQRGGCLPLLRVWWRRGHLRAAGALFVVYR